MKKNKMEIELTEAPAVLWLNEEEAGSKYSEEVCHLYRSNSPVAICGFVGQTHTGIDWEKGVMTCPACGCSVCMECILGVPSDY